MMLKTQLFRNLLMSALILSLFFAGHVSANPGNAYDLQRSFINVAKTLKPCVVNIRVERTESQSGIKWQTPFDNLPEGSPFEDFFKDFFKNLPQRRFRNPSPRYKTEAAGSGLVFDPSGIILTNNHVIRGASLITVKLSDETELKAEVVGQDPQSDLAIIKVNPPKPLTAAEFGDSDKVEVGQWSIAVGNPLGLEQTVTVGVVSAVGRSGIGATTIEDFIQTDASINPGNSGGPLVDIDGKVIGINTLIFTAPGSGIGFAIPSNMARRVAAQIVEHGKVERPYIGISMQQITPELAEHYSLKDRNGAVVIDLIKDGPAAKAGLKEMDIIKSINGREMKNTNDVQKYVLSREIGDKIDLTVLRNGKETKIKIALEKMPKTYGLTDTDDIEPEKADPESTLHKNLGFRFQSLSADAARELDIEGKTGLVVTEVESDSQAEKSGLQPDDIITQVNGETVENEESLLKALKKNKTRKSSVFLILRDSSPMFLIINHDKLD